LPLRASLCEANLFCCVPTVNELSTFKSLIMNIHCQAKPVTHFLLRVKYFNPTFCLAGGKTCISFETRTLRRIE